MQPTITITDLLDFCYQQSTPDKYEAILIQLLNDEDIFYAVRGIRVLQERLGARSEVEAWLNTQEDRLLARFSARQSPVFTG